MNNNYKILTQIPKYKLFRIFGYPKIFPLNLTISVTYRCNSKCKTCNIWKKERDNEKRDNKKGDNEQRDNEKLDELSIEEYDKIFKNIGKQPYWFTISGGEPFLRSDLVSICKSIYDNCKPGIINIPTNGILYQKIPKMVKEILDICSDTQIIINISLDEIGEKHDEIRCVKDNYNKAIATYEELRKLKSPNLEVGINTVISKFNVNRIAEIYEHVHALKPDSYITEIAEERVELDTIGRDITPNLEDYSRAIDFLCKQNNKMNSSGVSKITKYFRLQYYDIAKKTLKEKRQIIPCYAGFASAHIAPNGDIWQCCIKAKSIGNLRDNNYNFGDIWFCETAKKIRRSIKDNDCYCPLANASYTNIIHNFNILSKIGLKIVKEVF